MNAAARVLTGTRKFDRGLTQLMHDNLHWLDMPEQGGYRPAIPKGRHSEGPPLRGAAIPKGRHSEKSAIPKAVIQVLRGIVLDIVSY